MNASQSASFTLGALLPVAAILLTPAGPARIPVALGLLQWGGAEHWRDEPADLDKLAREIAASNGLVFAGFMLYPTETGWADAQKFYDEALAGVRAQTKAEPGDKTLIDVLVPAVDALRIAASSGSELMEALYLAAEAAEAGAKLTSTMQARFGRARNIKEQSIGTQDPGATSMSLLFRGFKKGFENHA